MMLLVRSGMLHTHWHQQGRFCINTRPVFPCCSLTLFCVHTLSSVLLFSSYREIRTLCSLEAENAQAVTCKCSTFPV
jgi:hypothetical protein